MVPPDVGSDALPTVQCVHCGSIYVWGCGKVAWPPDQAQRLSYYPNQQTQTHFSSGATSSTIPRWDLVWQEAIDRIATRCELGIEQHGSGAVNALTPPGDPRMVDKAFLIRRAVGAARHAFTLVHKLSQGIPLDEGDDDPAAIAWAGALLCAATVELKKQRQLQASGSQPTDPPQHPLER